MTTTICFDIDGILCQEPGCRQHPSKSVPRVGAACLLKHLVDKGYFISYWTSRPEIDRIGTAEWLRANGFPSAPLFMGKCQYDILVDDRSVHSLVELKRRLRNAGDSTL